MSVKNQIIFSSRKNNNSFSIKIGNISEMTGDCVLNWSVYDFRKGVGAFYELLSVGGSAPMGQIQTYLSNIKSGNFINGDVITTISGLLQYDIMLHCLIDLNNLNYNRYVKNIIATLNEYKTTNVCRDMYITIPNFKTSNQFIDLLIDNCNQINDMKFVFVCNNNVEFKLIEKNLLKHKSKFVENSLIYKVERLIYKIIKKIQYKRT